MSTDVNVSINQIDFKIIEALPFELPYFNLLYRPGHTETPLT
jgi:hypothetical protein